MCGKSIPRRLSAVLFSAESKTKTGPIPPSDAADTSAARGRRVWSDLGDRVLARPEVGRPIAVLHFVADRLYPVLEIRSDCPEVLIRHMPPRRPGHWHRQIMRMQREIPLSGSSRRNLDIGRL